MKYKVILLQNDTWQVVVEATADGHYASAHYQGSLADCEAWIRLTESGKMG